MAGLPQIRLQVGPNKKVVQHKKCTKKHISIQQCFSFTHPYTMYMYMYFMWLLFQAKNNSHTKHSHVCIVVLGRSGLMHYHGSLDEELVITNRLKEIQRLLQPILERKKTKSQTKNFSFGLQTELTVFPSSKRVMS